MTSTSLTEPAGTSFPDPVLVGGTCRWELGRYTQVGAWQEHKPIPHARAAPMLLSVSLQIQLWTYNTYRLNQYEYKGNEH